MDMNIELVQLMLRQVKLLSFYRILGKFYTFIHYLLKLE